MEIYRTPVSKNGKRNDPAVVAAAGRQPARTRTVSSRYYSLKKVVSMNERYTYILASYYGLASA